MAGARSGRVGETAVVGAKERGGKVADKPVPSTEAKTPGGFVQDTVEPGSAVYTEGYGSYGYL